MRKEPEAPQPCLGRVGRSLLTHAVSQPSQIAAAFPRYPDQLGPRKKPAPPPVQ